MKKIRHWFSFFAILIIVISSFFFFEKKYSPSGEIGLSSVVLPPLFDNDNNLDFGALKGKKYIVSVFASWCSVCAAEHTFWFSVSDKVDIYGVNYVDTPEKAILWLKKHGNPYKAIGADYAGVLGRFLKINGIPETFVVNEKGKVVLRFSGEMTEGTWNGIVKPMLDVSK